MNDAGKPAGPKPKDARVVQLKFPAAAKKAPDQAPEPAPEVASPATKPVKPPKPYKRKKGQRVDWEGLEPFYRGNKMSLREIGLMFDVRAPSIVKHARLQDPPWTRDAEGEIHARADELVNEATAHAANSDPDSANSTPRVVSRAIVIQATADLIAQVRLGQRQRFGEVASLATDMFRALREQFDNRLDLQTLGELMAQVTESGKPTELTKMYFDVVALPGQIKAFKDLSDIIGRLTDMETKAYKLEKAPEGGDGGRTNLPVRFVGTQWVERVEPNDDEDDEGDEP